MCSSDLKALAEGRRSRWAGWRSVVVAIVIRMIRMICVITNFTGGMLMAYAVHPHVEVGVDGTLHGHRENLAVGTAIDAEGIQRWIEIWV